MNMDAKSTQKDDTQKVVIVTGPAGAGRKTAINALEDLGFEALDNLPLNLFPRLLSGPPVGRPLAIGIDTRTRGFSVDALLELISNIEQASSNSVTLLYLDCAPDVLLRRFSETRRRHPQAIDGTPGLGIEREQELLDGLRNRADIILDTSEMSLHDLRSQCERWFSTRATTRLSVSVQSFSYKRGTPRGVDMVMDCRFLNNPHWQKDLRNLTGLDDAVAEFVAKDPLYSEFFEKLCGMLDLLLPAYRAEGKAYFSIAMGCTGGQHRSVCVAAALAEQLAQSDWQVTTRHREMERRFVPQGKSNT